MKCSSLFCYDISGWFAYIVGLRGCIGVQCSLFWVDLDSFWDSTIFQMIMANATNDKRVNAISIDVSNWQFLWLWLWVKMKIIENWNLNWLSKMNKYQLIIFHFVMLKFWKLFGFVSVACFELRSRLDNDLFVNGICWSCDMYSFIWQVWRRAMSCGS